MTEEQALDVEPEPMEDRRSELNSQLTLRPVQVGIETLERMQQRQEVIETLMANALKHTSNRHWLYYGESRTSGKPTDPRPENAAAAALARDLGISYVWLPALDGTAWEALPKSNGQFEVMYRIRGHFLGQFVEDLGTCSTDDPLLKKSQRADSIGERALFSDVMKKAMANAIVRLIQAFGVRAVTWEDLAKTWGVTVDEAIASCDRVQFKEGEESAAKTAANKAAAGKKCPKCGKAMTVRKRKSDGSPFLGCTGYPDCRHIENLAEPAPESHQPAPDPAKAVPPDDTPTPAPVAAPAGAETPQNDDAGDAWADEGDKPEALPRDSTSAPVVPPASTEDASSAPQRRTGPDAWVEENKRLGEQATKYVAGLSASEVKVKVFDYARTRFPKDKTTGMAFVSAVLGKTWATFDGMTTEDLRKVLVAFEVSQE